MTTSAQLLNDAISAMAELHESMEFDGNEENATVPPFAVRKFVDAHARLIYERERADDCGPTTIFTGGDVQPSCGIFG